MTAEGRARKTRDRKRRSAELVKMIETLPGGEQELVFVMLQALVEYMRTATSSEQSAD